MSDVIVIRPKDDAASRQSSTWCDDLIAELTAAGQTIVEDVDDQSPPDTATISAALSRTADLVCYFGHGDDDCCLTHGAMTIDGHTISAAKGKRSKPMTRLWRWAASMATVRFGPSTIVTFTMPGW